MADPLKPPARPLWDGIYDFAWRLANAKAFITCTICMMLLAAFACGFNWLFGNLMAQVAEGGLMTPGFDVAVAGGARIFSALVFLTVLCSIFPSACFIRIIESSAAGDEEIQWSDGVWFDFLKDFVILIWILVCAAAAPTAVLAILRKSVSPADPPWYAILLGGILALFPIMILSTMMGNAPWILIHYRVIARFLQKPFVPIILYLNTVFFGVPCLLLGYWMMKEHFWFFPLTGVVWATYWMTFARLLGRVGWVLTEEETGPERRRKRRRKVREEETAEVKGSRTE